MTHAKELLEVEDPAVEVLTKHLGWIEIDSREADGLRPSLKEPVLTEILKRKIKELNAWISEENVGRVVRSITNVSATSVLEANEKIQAMLEKGTTVRQDRDGRGMKSHDVILIDYENLSNNDFNVVRQFTVLHYDKNRPDVVLFINGLPVVVIECKSPVIQKPIEQGMEQIFRYQESQDHYRNVGCPKLFNTVQIVAVTSKYKMKYATNFTTEKHWSEWKEPYPLKLDDLQKELGRIPSAQDLFLFGVCTKDHLTDIIRNYVVYEREKEIVKKVCKYQQFRAVSQLIKRITQKRTAKGGVVWHTQGSGKSLSMLWTAVKLRRIKELANPTIVVVTDRTDLDDQIRGTFLRCGFPDPVQTKTAKHLQELLTNPVGQTIMTTIQKFQDATKEYPTLSENPNIFVLVDEAHRTQYKTLGANMRKAVPNARFIGFTGTPISKKYRSTEETFGDYVDVYDHKQAVNDGATVEIFYEGRLPELTITGNSIDQLFDRMFTEYSEKDKERIKSKYATPEEIAASTQRIQLVCMDIINHFEKYIQPNGFKAQIVATSRRTAIKYKQTLDKLKAPSSEVLISKNHNDETEFTNYHKSKTEEQEIIRRFKKEKDPQIIVVCDKLLTGFDAPIEQVMYLDSPLKEHTLLQAIARVNRTYKNKTYGLVVDYWGVSQDLQDALDMFTVEESEGIIHRDYKKEVLPRLQAAHNAAMNFFMDVNVKDEEECVQFLAPEDRRAAFDQRFKLFSNYMDMLLPDPAAVPFIKDFKWLAEIRARARNRYRDEQLSLNECSEKVRQLIEGHIKAESITRIVEPTSIFADKFDEEVERLTSDEAKASEIENAVKHEIHFKVNEDPVYYESLRQRLGRILDEFREGRMDAAKQLELLREVRQEVIHPEKQAEKAGVDREVMPFYNYLKEEGNPEEMKKTAKEVYDALDGLAVVEWGMKEDVKREMRRKIKRILRTGSYPKEKIESVTAKLLDLAKARFKR